MSDQYPPPPGGFPPPPPPSSGFPPPPPPGPSTPPPGYAAYGSPTTPVMQYAGFWARFAAYLIDAVIVSLMFVPAVVILIAGPTKISSCSIDESGNVTIGEPINGICEVPTGGTIAAAALLGLVALAGAFLYRAKLEGGPSGQTLGKRALGIKVVDGATGGPIGAGRAIGRFLFAGLISGNFCSLGYLWALWDGRKQTWHDKVVSSVVIKA